MGESQGEFQHTMNSFQFMNQPMTILLDKTGNEIGVFPSENHKIH